MVDYNKVPVPYMTNSVKLWVENGIRPGSFLTAVLANDFVSATVKADSLNKTKLTEWAQFIYNELPQDSWGSYEKLKEWEKRHGK